jgi:hypothetical protein
MARFNVGAEGPDCTALATAGFDESDSNPPAPDPDDFGAEGHRTDPRIPFPLQVTGPGGLVGAVVVGGGAVVGGVVGVVGGVVGVVGVVEAPGISDRPCWNMAAGLWADDDEAPGAPAGSPLRTVGI